MPTWGIAMEQLLGAVRNEKISSTVLAILLIFAYYAIAWANEEHENLVTKEEWQRSQSALTEQLSELTQAFRTYADDTTIIAASQLVRDKELQLQIAQATGKLESEIKAIESEIIAAKRYRTCLIERRPNCKHMKPPE